MISQITCLSGSAFFYLLCFNLNQICRKVVQDFATVVGDQDQVFDSYANTARDIDARFYGEAHAWFQDFFVGEGDIAKLVDFQSDIVSGSSLLVRNIPESGTERNESPDLRGTESLLHVGTVHRAPYRNRYACFSFACVSYFHSIPNSDFHNE